MKKYFLGVITFLVLSNTLSIVWAAEGGPIEGPGYKKDREKNKALAAQLFGPLATQQGSVQTGLGVNQEYLDVTTGLARVAVLEKRWDLKGDGVTDQRRSEIGMELRPVLADKELPEAVRRAAFDLLSIVIRYDYEGKTFEDFA